MTDENIVLQFAEVLQNNPDHAYDFISQNYWKMSKDELRDIAKELLYGIYASAMFKVEQDKLLEDVAIELKELYM